MIAEKPNMDHAGANVNLTITSSYLNLVSMENGDVSAFQYILYMFYFVLA